MSTTPEAGVLRSRAASMKWHVQREVTKANLVAPQYQTWLFDKHDHPDWKEAEKLLLKAKEIDGESWSWTGKGLRRKEQSP